MENKDLDYIDFIKNVTPFDCEIERFETEKAKNLGKMLQYFRKDSPDKVDVNLKQFFRKKESSMNNRTVMWVGI